MTMNIIKGEFIAGASAWDLRNFFRELRSRHRERFCSSELDKHLSLDEIRGSEVRQNLVREGYLVVVAPTRFEKDDTEVSTATWYELTDRGISLANASASHRIKRSTSERVLAEFMDRVHQVNRKDSGFMYTVTTLVVYGSFLSKKNTLGDVDLAVELAPIYRDPREQSDREDQHVQLALERGRTFSNFVQQLYWPRNEIMLFLKKRSRSLSLSELRDLAKLAQKGPLDYRVILGDEQRITEQLRPLKSQK